jgi:hypothetical protein
MRVKIAEISRKKTLLYSALVNFPIIFIEFLICHIYKTYLRPLLPIREFRQPISVDGVIFNKNLYGNLKIGDRLNFCSTFSQGAEISAHNRYTSEGDDVIIVGGGYGISAINAGKIVGPRGSVRVYEGGKISRKIRELIEWNGLREIVEVESVIVGKANELYGGRDGDAQRIHPARLPDCDVLELDCEGCEIGVLENLIIRPRIIIIELHPTKYIESNSKPLQIIEQMGYNIVNYANQPGLPLEKNLFMSRLSNDVGDVLIAEFDRQLN